MAERDDLGRWRPGGSSPNPNGRPTRRKEEEALEAINRAVPPEEIERILRDALAAARANNSWRGMLAVAETAMQYQIGKPIARHMSMNSRWQDLLAALDAAPAEDATEDDAEAGTVAPLSTWAKP